jgi:hypothetical protein
VSSNKERAVDLAVEDYFSGSWKMLKFLCGVSLTQSCLVASLSRLTQQTIMMGLRSNIIPSSLAPKISSLFSDPNSPKCAAVTTGGGAALGSWLIGTPGASAVLLEFQVPYVQSSLTQYLGGIEPNRFCSAETASQMSVCALNRAKELWLSNNNGDLLSLANTKFVGLGGSATLVSASPKRGNHRAFVASTTDEGTRQFSITMTKGARDRVGEDEMVSRLLLRALISSSGVDMQEWDDDVVDDSEVVTEVFVQRTDPLESLLSDDHPASSVLFVPSKETGKFTSHPDFVPKVKKIVYPGSFNRNRPILQRQNW